MKNITFYILTILISATMIAGCSRKDDTAKNAKNSKSTQFIAQGMDYLRQSDVRNAIRSFDMAIKTDPKNVENYLVLGQVYLQLKNFQGAVDVLTAATRIDPNSGEAYYLLATSRGLRGKDEDKIESVAAAKKSVEIFLKERDEERFKKAVVLLQGLTTKNSDGTAENGQMGDSAASMEGATQKNF